MYKILLCLRYLRTRYIALASIISVMLGVATMIVVNSVMSGFSGEMRDRLHGILADVIVETSGIEGSPNAERDLQIVEKVAGQFIEAMTATVEVYGMMSFRFADQDVTVPVTLIGIEPDGKAKVGPLVEYLDSYQAIVDDNGVVTRPALRSADEPPGWELTESAKEYRKTWVTIHNWRQDFDEQETYESGGDPPFQEQDVVPAGADSDAVPPFTSSELPAEGVLTAHSATEEDDAEVDLGEAVEQPIEPENPLEAGDFANGPNEWFPPTEQDTVDPLEPFPARLYVGAGRISYPLRDADGKVKTHWMVQPGDDVKITTVSAGQPPEPRPFNATVVDIFKSGMSEYDANLVFCNLEELQLARGMIDPETGKGAITSIQIKLKDYRQADDVIRRLQAAFPPGYYSVKTWEQKQGPLLAAVEIESAILNVLLFLIITVAGFGILAIFFMIVVEKTRDIGILKALGASSHGVMAIFLSYGLALGIVGSGVGVVIGLLFVRYINEIEDAITWLTGRKVFDETIYYFPTIPTSVEPSMVAGVALGAMTIAVLASVLPARRAARLHPVQALRYE